jgi:hypothetical protein
MKTPSIKAHSLPEITNSVTNKPRLNQKFLDEAKKEREEPFEQMKNISSQFVEGYISTQQLANIIYPYAPTYPAGFTTKKKYMLNVYGDFLAGRLKRMEKDGLIESIKSNGKRLWRIKQNEENKKT